MCRQRQPCVTCGGPKPPGRKHYCDPCAVLAAARIAQKKREQAARWRREHPEQSRQYHAERRQRPGQRERAREISAAWKTANRERYLEVRRAWNEAHPDRLCDYSRSRRAREVDAFVETVAPLAVLERDDGVCGICGGDVDPFDFHVDHIVPLARGGKHSYSNVQTTHPLCNQRKGTAMPLKEVI